VCNKAEADDISYLTMLRNGCEWEMLLSESVRLERKPEFDLPLPPEVLNFLDVMDGGAVIAAKAYFAERLA